MDRFKSIEIKLPSLLDMDCQFEEHTEESILYVKVSGTCSKGSEGEDYGRYLYQKIGLGILQVQPHAVLVDLQNLSYVYGDRILDLFQVFSDIRLFGEHFVITAFVLSDQNNKGLASLLQFDLENPEPPLFYTIDDAYQFLFKEYDKI